MMLALNKRAFILSSIIISAVFSTLYLKPFSSTEINILDHLTENNNGTINQICLVKNPPSDSGSLLEIITKFNQTNQSKNGNYRRLFIKQHEYSFLSALTLGENIDYSSKAVLREDLNNIDFLGSSSSFLTKKGKRINTLEANIGALWHYKK